MDVLEGPDFMFSRICLKPFGLWPFEDPKSKRISRVITLAAVSTIFIPQVVMAYEFRKDFSLVMLCLPALLYYVHYMTKFLFIVIREDKFRRVMERIKDDFVLFRNEHLHQIAKYSEEARKFNAFYAMYLFSTIITYNSTAFIPRTLDLVFPLANATRVQHPVRYLKYNIRKIDSSFYFGSIHGMMFDFVAIGIIIGFDTLLINCSQHACALFRIVDVQLRNSTERNRKLELSESDSVGLRRREEALYERLVQVVIDHKHAIEFTDHVESTYALINFLMIGIAVGTSTMTEFGVLIYSSEVDIMSRYALFFAGQLLNMLYQNYPGQKIKDYSSQVNSSCYECAWYREDISYRCRKLLMFMMLRSEIPRCLTAGSLFVMDLQNYGKIFKASLSYFAFLSSVAHVQ